MSATTESNEKVEDATSKRPQPADRRAISGFKISKQLYESAKTNVVQAVCERTNARVVIKLLRNEIPELDERVRLRNEYVIGKELDVACFLLPQTLVPFNNGFALVFEDVGGISLSQYVQNHGALSVQQFVEIALQLADCLQQLSQHRVLHRDINPNNILIHPETHQVWLIDFGLGSLLPRESQELESPSSLEGTLAYMAPEQTGRMNRGIDFRADFYGVGVTLYELLTGCLPFNRDDPMELIHCHIAKTPMPPCDVPAKNRAGAIPVALSDIVLRLLAKNPEQRYQSALGLKHDLQKCLDQLQTSERIESFELGQQDRCERFLIPEKLYGRETEVQALLDSFNRVSQGASEIMLVAGYSGVGKTVVVNEVHKPIVARRGYFAKGKFDQFNRNVPFSAFAQVFRDLMGQLLGESDAALQLWKAKILEALGGSGQVLIDLIPELETVIGEQPSVAELSGTAAQNRFDLLFEKFVGVFATKDHPLVFFLDDLQWADSASLNLLKLLVGHRRSGYLLLVGAYRDNEVFPAHPLSLALTELENSDSPLSVITLTPLALPHVNQLVAESLGCDSEVAEPVTELVFQKTAGNPFFAIRFLTGLHDDGLISFNRSFGNWECNFVKVRQAELSDDVVEFMVGRLQKLPKATQDVLKLAAGLGNQFDLETLSIICDTPAEKVAADLWDALREGLLIPQSQAYKLFQPGGERVWNASVSASYRFLHDRVQQSAYAMIPDQQRSSLHWNIGQVLLSQMTADRTNEQLFQLVNQLNLGRSEVSDTEQAIAITELNLEAGNEAKSAAAFQSAFDYFEKGIESLSVGAWNDNYKVTYDLFFGAAETAYLTGQFERTEEVYRISLQHARNDLDQAAILRLQMTQRLLQGLNQDAISIQRRGLQLLGWQVPVSGEQIEAELCAQVDVVDAFLRDHTIESIPELPVMEDETCQEMMRILQVLFYAAWFDGQNSLAFLALAKMTTLSLEHGNSEMSPFGYVGHGLLLNARLQRTSLAHDFGKMAVNLCERFDNADVKAMTNFLFAADVHSWSRPLRESETYYENAYKYGMEAGNWLTVSFMMMQSGSDRLTASRNLNELHEIASTHADFLDRVKNQGSRDALTAGVLQPVKNLLGLTDAIDSFDDSEFKEADYVEKYAKADFHLAWLYSVQIRHAFLFRRREQYADLIPKWEVVAQAVPSHAKVPSTAFYVALMHLSLVETETDDAKRVHHFGALAELEAKLDRWCENCPANIKHKLLLIRAEKARLNGGQLEAIHLYDAAIASASKESLTCEEALANELAGEFYLQWGKETIAKAYLQEAYQCYRRWGANGKIAELEKRHGDSLMTAFRPEGFKDALATLNEITPLNIADHYEFDDQQPVDNGVLDLATIFKSAQTLSASADLSELLEKLAPMMLQTSGAERLALLLPNEDNVWETRVTATPDDTKLVSEPLRDNRSLPVQLIQYVQRTKEIFLADGLASDLPFVDSYLQKNPHRSLLCLPLIHQKKLGGLLYLEHSSVSGVFNPERITIANFLCAQTAIARENSRLLKDIAERKELQQQQNRLTARLERTHQRLHKVLKCSSIGIWEWSMTDERLTWDDQMFQIYGVDPADFRGVYEDWSDRLHPDDFERVTTEDQCRSESEISDPTEFRIVRANGEVRHIYAYVYFEKNDQQETVRTVGINIDVTALRQAELGLLESESKFQRITERLPGMVYRYVVHPDGSDKLEYVNSGVRELFEVSPEEAVDGITSIWDRIHKDDREWLGEAIALSAEKLEPFVSEYRLELPEKGLRWVQSYSQPIRGENGEVIWDGIVLDHTERKTAQLALQDAESQFHRVTENVPGMIYRCVRRADGSQVMSYVSSQVRELYEIEPEEAIQDINKLLDCIHPEDIDAVLDAGRASATSLAPLKTEYRVILPKRGLCWRQSISQPTRTKEGDIVWDGVIIDVTQRKQAELQLQLANEQLADATKMKDEFLANMSHELRTPLNAILGMTEGLQGGLFGSVTEKQIDSCEVIQQSGAHLLDLINEVLDLAKIESGSMDLELSPVNAAKLCASSLKLVGQLAEKKNIQLAPNLPINLPEFEADEKRLRQVLVNLLSNAVKFSPHGGVVTLEVQQLDNENDGGKTIRFSVSDNGIGIESRHLRTLFDPFVQVDSALNRNYTGTGLGLSLVKRFVELHSGSVSVTSEPGVGSCFIVDLPLRACTNETAKSSRRIDPPSRLAGPKAGESLQTGFILLAEDNELVAKTAVRFLEAMDFQVELATNGGAAIEAAGERLHDVILMDVQMPGIDGLEAIQRIRQIPKHEKTPIIALTGLAMQDDANRCFAAGADHYLSKPYRMQELVELIRKEIADRDVNSAQANE